MSHTIDMRSGPRTLFKVNAAHHKNPTIPTVVTILSHELREKFPPLTIHCKHVKRCQNWKALRIGWWQRTPYSQQEVTVVFIFYPLMWLLVKCCMDCRLIWAGEVRQYISFFWTMTTNDKCPFLVHFLQRKCQSLIVFTAPYCGLKWKMLH